jgi:hypothetical protein
MESAAGPTVGVASHLVLALVFVVAGATKLVDQRASITVERVALRDLLLAAHRATSWRFIGVIEVITALLALSPFGGARVGLVIVGAGALAYTAWAWRWRSQLACGCFGAASREPAGARTVLRSAFLLVLATATWFSPEVWWYGLTGPSVWLSAAVAGLLFLLLSPELRAVKTHRQRHCLKGYAVERRVATALPASDAWQRLAGVIGPRAPLAMWNEHCVRFVAFHATVGGQPAFAVFAVGVRGINDAIRGTLVDGRGNPLASVGESDARAVRAH